MTQAVVKSPLGGDYLSMQCRQFLEAQGIDLTPSYKIASKDVVKDRDTARFTLKTNVPERLTNSWQQYMLKQLLQDFQMTAVQVLETPYDEKVAAQIPAVHHEFPTGYHQDFGPERFKLAESLFDHNMLGAGQLASTSVCMCDADVRLSLYGSVVVTGGNTLLQVKLKAFLVITKKLRNKIFKFIGFPRTSKSRLTTTCTIKYTFEDDLCKWKC